LNPYEKGDPLEREG